MRNLELKRQVTKTLAVKPNGRSSDFVSPNHILSCNAGCSYCYTYRFGRKFVYINTNIDQILNSVLKHSETLPAKQPNQTDSKYWTYDIGCDVDLNYHWKDYDWNKVLNFYINTPNIKATFATKFVNYNLLKYGNEKLRTRFSLMPQNISNVLEKNTSKIHQRINAIDRFIDAGWDCHINLSPVIYYNEWLKDYQKLFEDISKIKHKDKILSEVIFLTHNKNLHDINLQNNHIEAEKLLWTPFNQENKQSQYGGDNVRYEWKFKSELIDEFKHLYGKYFDLKTIRYIF